jgi:hypothetical protein
MPKRNLKDHHYIDGTLAHAQRGAIIAALICSDYKITRAASRLKIGRNTLYRLIADLDVPRPPKTTLDLINCSIAEARSLPTSRIIFSDGRYSFAPAHEYELPEQAAGAATDVR